MKLAEAVFVQHSPDLWLGILDVTAVTSFTPHLARCGRVVVERWTCLSGALCSGVLQRLVTDYSASMVQITAGDLPQGCSSVPHAVRGVACHLPSPAQQPPSLSTLLSLQMTHLCHAACQVGRATCCSSPLNLCLPGKETSPPSTVLLG